MTEQRSDELLDGFPVESSAASGRVIDAAGGRVSGPARRLSAVPQAHASGDDAHLAALLDTMVERRCVVDRAEADLLRLVVEFADHCPQQTSLATIDPHVVEPGVVDPGVVDGPRPPADEAAVVELGARLGLSYRAAAGLVTEAVELRDRLPRLWDLVGSGRLQAWKARQEPVKDSV